MNDLELPRRLSNRVLANALSSWFGSQDRMGCGFMQSQVFPGAPPRPRNGLMDLRKVFAVAAAGMSIMLPAVAHPGPEPHPTVQELEDVVAELRSAIGEVDRRLGERIDGLELPVAVLDEQAVANTVQAAVGDTVGQLVQSSNDLKDWVEAVAALGATLMAGLTGVSAFLGFRVRALRKLLSRSLQPASEPQQVRAEPSDGAEQDDDEEEQSAVQRFVTHTLKARIRPGMQPTIKELHNPDASWSPRTVDQAIADIDGGTRYWARGPDGNEAEIEVRQGPTKRYLRTKPDEHGGNNLGELPDP